MLWTLCYEDRTIDTSRSQAEQATQLRTDWEYVRDRYVTRLPGVLRAASARRAAVSPDCHWTHPNHSSDQHSCFSPTYDFPPSSFDLISALSSLAGHALVYAVGRAVGHVVGLAVERLGWSVGWAIGPPGSRWPSGRPSGRPSVLRRPTEHRVTSCV